MAVEYKDLEQTMPPDRERFRAIGSILVKANRLDDADVDEIQAYAHRSGLRFGDAAVKLNLVTPEDVEFALARQYNYPLLTHGPEGVVSDEVIAAYDPDRAAVEDLRTIRSRLMLNWFKRAGRNILAIASPERGDGRSWFAANLATVFAQSGERTLLIDADMRQPRQHLLFNVDNHVGLSAALTGRAGREVAQRVHPNMRLFVLTAGLQPPNPQELITRKVFQIVLDTLAKQFDVIILDTPACSGVADGQVLAARAGSALLLARRHHTLHAKLQQTERDLLGSGANLIGSVINEF